ncbi:MAG TPA: hypothetical protein VGA46_05780 [Methyloceanibacter sp.]
MDASTGECGFARAGLWRKNFYFLQPSETTLRLFASYRVYGGMVFRYTPHIDSGTFNERAM